MTQPAPPNTVASRFKTLLVISQLLWEREGEASFETSRAKLLDTLTQLTNRIQKSQAEDDTKLNFILLGGQTVLFEDIATIRPDLVPLLSIYNSNGRIGVGPWYVQVDDQLVSGESLIRNLLLAGQDVKRHGITLLDIGYIPQAGEHIAQLPQILQGFGMDAIFMVHESPVLSLPFLWCAPDGSSVLAINHSLQTDINKSLASQKRFQPDGPFLWLNIQLMDEQVIVSQKVDMPLRQRPLSDIISLIRKAMPDKLRAKITGTLRPHGPGRDAGRFSAQLHLKQANGRLQSQLTYNTEPWLTLALTHGNLPHVENMHALLDHVWRLLIKNQARNALIGYTQSTVHLETELRNQQIADVSTELINRAFDALPGTLYRQQPQTQAETTYLVVWNPHSQPVEQVVDVQVTLPDNRYPDTLNAPKGESQNFAWEIASTDADYTGTISFRASVPPVGYAVYTLKLGTEKPKTHHFKHLSKGHMIGNVVGATLKIENGKLIWTTKHQEIEDVLRFVDGGDAGDIHNYVKPTPDVLAQGTLTDSVQVEVTPTSDTLIFRHRMRITSGLDANGGRTRGVSLLELTTRATFYDNVPGIYFRTTFNNKVNDHRLRAHLHTGLKSGSILSDSAFAVDTFQKVEPSNGMDTNQAHIRAMQTFCGVQQDDEAILLLTRGAPEWEPIAEDEQTTLALTLLRAVGWLQRPTNGNTGIPAPHAQANREMSINYALMPMSDPNPAKMLHAGLAYQAPLQAYQYSIKPDATERSFLHLDEDNVVLTALKPPQDGKGWIARLLNPTDDKLSMTLTPYGKVSKAQVLNLAEKPQSDITLADGKAKVDLNPHQIVTVRLDY